MKLVVIERKLLSDNYVRFVFKHAFKDLLPQWEPGSHVDVKLPDGRLRQYSLVGDPDDLAQYTIIIKKELQGRGGSEWLFDRLRLGDFLRVSKPRNNFSVGARSGVIIAGGIGVTPLIPIGRALSKDARLQAFHFTSRESQLLIAEELSRFCGDRLHLYTSIGPREKRMNIQSIINNTVPETDVYVCGPDRLMTEVKQLTAHWSEDRVHHESFQLDPDNSFKAEPFDLTVRRTGVTYRVKENQTALDVLRREGHVVPSSCRMGVCGTCKTRYVSGQVIHRDTLLSSTERQTEMLICVSRGRGSIMIDV